MRFKKTPKTKKRKFIKVENTRTRNNKKDHRSVSIFSVDGNLGNLASRYVQINNGVPAAITNPRVISKNPLLLTIIVPKFC